MKNRMKKVQQTMPTRSCFINPWVAVKCKSDKTLEGLVVVVTGGTAGMGLEIATDIARRGAKVIVACPFENEGTNAIKTITEKTGSNKVTFKMLDLSSLDSVREVAAAILKEETRLDILFNNAGVGVPVNPKSYNGTNYIMHVNFIGHFLLTILLLPILRKTGTKAEPSRIINTGSVLHWFGKLDFECKNRRDIFDRLMCYSNSKYNCILFGHALSKRFKEKNIVVNAVDPGAVGTGLFNTFFGGRLAKYFFMYCYKNAKEGAQTALHAALDDDAGRETGKYYRECHLIRPKSSARDEELADKLWEEAVQIVKLGPYELERCLYGK